MGDNAARRLRETVVRYRARIDPARLRRASRRLVIWLVLAAGVGAITGLGVVAMQFLVFDLLADHVASSPGWVQVAAPGAGLALAWATLRILRAPGSETGEEYVKAFHERRTRLTLKDLLPKLVAGAFTVGLGGSLGLEGPSLLIGGTVGDSAQSRFPALFGREEAKVMMVAGAAAGIAAVFKAPLTGLVFAMEVPYRDDFARHVLGPSLIGAAAGYLVEASFRGVEPLMPIVGQSAFGFRELAFSLLLGFLAGLAGRGVISTFRWFERMMARLRPLWRIVAAGAGLAAVAGASQALFGQALTLGPGDRAVKVAAAAGLTVGALLALLALKVIATSITTAAGGVGGIFIPLITMGTALGAVFQRLVRGSGTLFPIVGMASLLGSAYHTPLAGVSFVAEATGKAGFIIPTFIAAAAAYATIGGMSISGLQRARRLGPVEAMIRVPVTDVATLERATVEASESLNDFVKASVTRRYKSFAVLDGQGLYQGMIHLDQVIELGPERWASQEAGDLAQPRHPSGEEGWSLYEALDIMAAAEVDALPILRPDGGLVGLVRTSEVLRLREIVERLRPGAQGPQPR